MEKKLYKTAYDKKIDGVCNGIAEYLNIDVTIVRLVFAVGLLFGGFTFVLYILCALIFPEKIRP